MTLSRPKLLGFRLDQLAGQRIETCLDDPADVLPTGAGLGKAHRAGWQLYHNSFGLIGHGSSMGMPA